MTVQGTAISCLSSVIFSRSLDRKDMAMELWGGHAMDHASPKRLKARPRVARPFPAADFNPKRGSSSVLVSSKSSRCSSLTFPNLPSLTQRKAAEARLEMVSASEKRTAFSSLRSRAPRTQERSDSRSGATWPARAWRTSSPEKSRRLRGSLASSVALFHSWPPR